MDKMAKPKTTANEPSVTFNFMAQDWRSVKWACLNDELFLIGESIQKRIDGVPATNLVEIVIPIDCCRMIAR